jgi:hypothetical protein
MCNMFFFIETKIFNLRLSLHRELNNNSLSGHIPDSLATASMLSNLYFLLLISVLSLLHCSFNMLVHCYSLNYPFFPTGISPLTTSAALCPFFVQVLSGK